MSTPGKRIFRPLLHFTPSEMWMNDPNGLVFENGNYHLFYQYHPESTVWGPMHWGHAKSRDLLSWQHLPVALYPDDLGYIFSGSAVYDEKNTAGFGEEGKTAIVAMFTHHKDFEQQSLAYSLDGETFTKYAGNPVIPNDQLKDFRDPKIFWNPQKGCWGVVLAAGDRVIFYSSLNLKEWEKTGEFGPEGNFLPGVWECPDLFPLTIEGQTKWVLLVSMSMPTQEGGARTQYFLGDFDGSTFHCEPDRTAARFVDCGFDHYAGVTYQNTEERYLIGWGINWQYADKTPTGVFCGMMTLPRRLSLIQTPHDGIQLRGTLPCLDTYLEEEIPIASGDALTSEVFLLRASGEGACVFSFSNAQGQVFRFGVDAENQVFVDRCTAGENGFSPIFASARYGKACAARFFKGSWQLELLFDVSACELYADNGSLCFAQVLYPDTPYQSLSIEGSAQASIRLPKATL